MAGKARTRVVFVGAGNMGQCAHLRNYATLPECQVVALAELREDIGRQVAARYAIPKLYSTAEEMLRNESFDAIVASQPFRRHGVLLSELLKARKPVFIEKPLSGSIQAAEGILRRIQDSETFVMVGYHKRSDPATMAAKTEIERFKVSGELGKLKYVRVTMPKGEWIAGGFFDRIDGEPKPDLETDPPAEDMDEATYKAYVSFVNYYIHQVNLIRFFLGEPYRVTYAEPADVLLVGQSASGVPCLIEMNPYRTTLEWRESALIAFEKGYVRVDLPAPLAMNRPGRVEIFSDPGNGVAPKTVTLDLPWVHAMRQQAMNFLAAVRGERLPPCDAFEALEDLKVAREYIRLRYGS